MKLVIQRVSRAKMYVNGNFKCEIGRGIVIFLGITHGDNTEDIKYCVDKLVNLRIFPDENEKMNLSIKDVLGELLIVSNFSIYGDVRKGRLPSYVESAPTEIARGIYNKFLEKLEETNIPFKTGEFQEHMDIEVMNDGPITLIIESPIRKG